MYLRRARCLCGYRPSRLLLSNNEVDDLLSARRRDVRDFDRRGFHGVVERVVTGGEQIAESEGLGIGHQTNSKTSLNQPRQLFSCEAGLAARNARTGGSCSARPSMNRSRSFT